MSKICLFVSKQSDALEEFTLFHFTIKVCKITDVNEKDCVTLISYEKKKRAKEILNAFKKNISESLDRVEGMNLAFMAIKKKSIYACFRPCRSIERLITSKEATDKVSFNVMNCLHLYW